MTERNPEITIFFSVGIIGMDEPVTEYITVPIGDFSDDAVLQKKLATQMQLAQMKMQLGFIEMMTTRFPEWAMKKFEEEGWDLPDDFLG